MIFNFRAPTISDEIIEYDTEYLCTIQKLTVTSTNTCSLGRILKKFVYFLSRLSADCASEGLNDNEEKAGVYIGVEQRALW